MFGMGWGELMVLAVVGLFVLGPERLPAAIRWTTTTITQLKAYAAAAKDHLDSPEFAEFRKPLDELREPLAELRAADPRRALRTTLLSSLAPTSNTTRPRSEHVDAQPETTEPAAQRGTPVDQATRPAGETTTPTDPLHTGEAAQRAGEAGP